MTNFAILPKSGIANMKLVFENDWGWKVQSTGPDPIEQIWEKLYCGWENGAIGVVSLVEWIRAESRREFDLMERYVKMKRKTYAH